MSAVKTLTVGEDETGIRLDRWFKRHYPDLPHVILEKLLRTGQVRVDGGRAKAADRLEAGQAIRVPPTAHVAPPKKKIAKPGMPVSDKDAAFIRGLILHQDPDVIVLNKPHGLAAQGGSGIERSVDGLLDALSLGKSHRPRLVHRLDRDTTGVLVIARTPSAAAALSEAFRARETRKIYWALVNGVPRPHRGKVALSLAKEGGHGKHGRDERMVPLAAGDDREDAKRAVTHYAVLDAAASACAWVALMPITGRTHQLRAHMAAIGCPIVGDFKYGGSESRLSGEVPKMLHLHARSIQIKHPKGGILEVVAPLPPHMKKSWALFGFSADDTKDPFIDFERGNKRK